MDKADVVAALAALAQEHRLEIYRYLCKRDQAVWQPARWLMALGSRRTRYRFTLIGCGMQGLVTFAR